jgi:hypothetical protein
MGYQQVHFWNPKNEGGVVRSLAGGSEVLSVCEVTAIPQGCGWRKGSHCGGHI